MNIQAFVYSPVSLLSDIVFVWSQYDGGNIGKEHWLRFPPKPNEAKLIILRRDFLWILISNILIKSFIYNTCNVP